MKIEKISVEEYRKAIGEVIKNIRENPINDMGAVIKMVNGARGMKIIDIKRNKRNNKKKI